MNCIIRFYLINFRQCKFSTSRDKLRNVSEQGFSHLRNVAEQVIDTRQNIPANIYSRQTSI